MSEMQKKAAYLRGLADGLEWDRLSPHGRILDVMMEVLDEVTLKIEEIESRIEVLEGNVGGLRFVDDMFDDNGEFEITCSNCKERVLVGFDMLSEEGTVICPACQRETNASCGCDCGC